ncbi:MAG: UbiA family prenyltransferase [Bacteroidota bacterium]
MLYYLKVSRPGLWFATIWLYFLPTGQQYALFESWIFWYGLFYVCFPLNFIVYGWNDIVDFETDKFNLRKDSFWFGARASKEQLERLWKPILWSQVLFFTPLLYFGSWKLGIVYILFIFINALYNLPRNGLRSKPPFELVAQIGYLLIVPLSILINELNSIPWMTYVYLLLFAWQSHLIGEVMDIDPDRKAGRKTTATLLGMKGTKILIITIVSLEVTLMYFHYQEFIFGSLLACGLLWLLIDLLIIYKTKRYSYKQMKLFAILSNAVAIVSMIYVWYSGCLI